MHTKLWNLQKGLEVTKYMIFSEEMPTKKILSALGVMVISLALPSLLES